MVWAKKYPYRFGDIDHAGIAYYPALLHYVHCAFEDWWAEALGTPYPEVLNEERFGLPAVHIEADFYAPIRYGDEPIVSVGVLRLGVSSVDFGFVFRNEGNGDPVVRARVTGAGIDVDTMAKMPLPDRWRAAFEGQLMKEEDFPSGR